MKEVIVLKFNNKGIYQVCFGLILFLLISSVGINVYADEKVDLKFDEARSFLENLAAVKVNGKWGLIDVKGNFVVPAEYESISFYKETAIIKIAGKYGVISTTGKEIIPAQYEEITYSKDWRNRPQNELLAVKQGSKWGVCDRSGKEIVPVYYDKIEINSNGTINVSLNSQVGLLDKNGRTLIPVGYSFIFSSSRWDEKDSLKNLSTVGIGGKWGIVDQSGKEIIPVVYDRVSMGANLIRVQKDKKFGFSNYRGQEVIPLKYDEDWRYAGLYYFSEGMAAVSVAGKWGYIDEKDRTVIPLAYDSGYPFKDGLAVVALNKKQGLINKENKIIIPLQYDNLYHLAQLYNGSTMYAGDNLIIAKSKDKEGVFGTDGRAIIPLKYESINSIGDGLFKVQLNTKYGVIDKTDKVIIPIQSKVYEYIQYDENKTFRVFNEGNWKFYKQNGAELIPTEYNYALPFANGLAPVKVNNKWGYIDWEGKLTPWSY